MQLTIFPAEASGYAPKLDSKVNQENTQLISGNKKFPEQYIEDGR
jgi:hypothetical protein